MESEKSMMKGQMKSFTCPVCGWTVKTPWGENDIMEHADIHGKKHHPDMKMTEEEMKNMIK